MKSAPQADTRSVSVIRRTVGHISADTERRAGISVPLVKIGTRCRSYDQQCCFWGDNVYTDRVEYIGLSE